MTVNYRPRCVSAPTTAHWTAVKRVLRYLHGPRKLKLVFPRPQALQKGINTAVCGDADWAGDDDTKSTSGCLLAMNIMPIAWYSKKQSTVALSIAEV